MSWNFVHIISDNLISNPHEVVELYMSGYKHFQSCEKAMGLSLLHVKLCKHRVINASCAKLKMHISYSLTVFVFMLISY